MKTDLIPNVLSLLDRDATMLTLLGGTHNYRAKTATPEHVPSVTVEYEDDVGGRRTCYNQFRTRDGKATLKFHVWTRTSAEHCDSIEARVDAALSGDEAIVGTRAWVKTPGGLKADYDAEADVFHTTFRYDCEYTIIDS